jgi:hypothetical protein
VTLLLLLSPVVCASLFLAMRQDLQAHLLQRRIARLAERREQLQRDLGEDRRALAARLDISRIVPELARRGFEPPDQERVLALTPPPARDPAPRSIPLSVLDFLAGVSAVQAAPLPETARAGASGDGEGRR